MDIKKPWLISAIATTLVGGGWAGIVLAFVKTLIVPAIVGVGLIAGGCALKYFQKDIEVKYGAHILKIEEVLDFAGLDEEKMKEILGKLLGELVKESMKVEIPEIELRRG